MVILKEICKKLKHWEVRVKYKVLEDFETYEEVEQDVIRLYKSKIPEKLLDTWKEYGFGSFMDNYMNCLNHKIT